MTWKKYLSEANISTTDEMKIIALHNAECVFIAEILPKVLECYNKYAGKNVGEKTEAKIKSAINEIIDDERVSVYMDNGGIHYYLHYSLGWQKIYFTHYNVIENICGYDQEVLRSYRKWDKNGKLNHFTMDMFFMPTNTIIENAEAYLAEKREKVVRYKELCDEIEKVRNEYNNNLCNGFKEMVWQVANSYFRMK